MFFEFEDYCVDLGQVIGFGWTPDELVEKSLNAAKVFDDNANKDKERAKQFYRSTAEISSEVERFEAILDEIDLPVHSQRLDELRSIYLCEKRLDSDFSIYLHMKGREGSTFICFPVTDEGKARFEDCKLRLRKCYDTFLIYRSFGHLDKPMAKEIQNFSLFEKSQLLTKILDEFQEGRGKVAADKK